MDSEQPLQLLKPKLATDLASADATPPSSSATPILDGFPKDLSETESENERLNLLIPCSTDSTPLVVEESALFQAETFSLSERQPARRQKQSPPASLLSLGLLSYSSATTLALIWSLWTARSFSPAHPVHEEPFPPPRLSSSIIQETQPVPLPPENLVSIGKSTILGSIEVTPVRIERVRVTLAHAIDPTHSREEKGHSLLLVMRITNHSRENAIAPLERASVRECPGIPIETYLQTECSKIPMYPLALESEWRISGQTFPLIKPGETAEILLATSPFPDQRLSESMTWHARLRVAAHQTNVVGVQFSSNEIMGP